MTSPSSSFSPRGAVDLSVLNRPQAPPPGTPGGAPASGGYVTDVTDEASFQAVIEGSMQYPVIVLVWIPTDAANADTGTMLGRLVNEAAGRLLLARVDAASHPQIAQAFQVQGVPTVFAVIQGQPQPLFQGGAAEEQVRAVLDQVVAFAEQNGMTGRAPAADSTGDAAEDQRLEPPLPPLHQEAFDAIERGDLAAAEAAYDKARKQDPKDDLATAGLAQVRLMIRTQGQDPTSVRAQADALAEELQAAGASAVLDSQALDTLLLASDVDLMLGEVDQAFARLLALLPLADADVKDSLRLRLVDYFEVVGASDPRVLKARQRLALYLY